MSPTLLPPGIQVFERGWLSANNVLLRDGQRSWLVDTGYVTHAEQTLALVQQALGAQPLDHIVNTHLHSDHCGGNAQLQAAYPDSHTWVPAPSWHTVAQWNESALTYHATGQACPRFTAQHAMSPGDTLPMGGTAWHVLAAPGHDNDAVLLFAPEHRVLIAGDALWANGLSIVFPEIGAQGDWGAGFAAVADTLALIESLQPRLVIAGHGPLITDPPAALAQARSRLAHFQRKPAAHALYAAKVLLKFHLLAVQHSTVPAVLRWMAHTPDLQALHRLSQSGNGNAREPEQANAREASFDDWAQSLIQALAQSGAARLDAGHIHNA